MRIRSARVTFMILSCCASVLVLVCWFGGYSCSAQQGAAASQMMASAAAGTIVSEGSTPQVNTVAAACRLIYQGQFDAAEELAGQAGLTEKPRAQLLGEIIQQYDRIDGHRKAARQAAYSKQLEELEKLKTAGVLERPDHLMTASWDGEPDEGEGTRDANEPNDVPDVLAVIARAGEFASDEQKKELLSDMFVSRIMQEAVNRSVLLEAQGKWLDAYTSYFYWLQAIDPNSRGYVDHAEELLDRAAIAASFQDSPCESLKERYEGIEERMVEKAIDALDLHYVNSIDYAQMALKGIKRCGLLAEVLAIAFAEGVELSQGNSVKAPASDTIAAWTTALAGLRDEIEESVPGFGKEAFLAIMDKVLSLNDSTVELPRKPLVAHFSEAALSELDPYTVMVWPRQVQDFEKLMTNEFTGIGIEISKPKGLLTVASLLPDTPAYRSGLDAGDVIEAVDGVPTKDMSLMCAVKKITGPKGTKVALTIRRTGGGYPETLTLTRDRIIVPTIRGWQRTNGGNWQYMIDETQRIGYVRITSFSGETASDLEGVLEDLEKQGLKALILDLRFNTGGLLDSAVDVTDKFVSEGLIVKTQPKANAFPSYEHAHRRGTHSDYPLVLLINSGSASASEIVAGALGDPKHERAILVGTRTHGKGSVQGITQYPGGGAQLKYTMAYYLLPSGQRVKSRADVEKEGRKDWGVGPDVEVTLNSEELRAMLDAQRDNDVLVQAHREEGKPSPQKRTVDETLRADPQLAVGLLVAKTKLIETDALAAN